jgi:predicted acyl esterase
MNARALPLLLTLALTPLVTACDVGPFRLAGFEFANPTPGAIVATEPGATFVLRLPKYRSDVALWLDGAPLDPSDWIETEREARGTLDGVDPGPHELRAEVAIPVVFRGLQLRFTTTSHFEMGAGASFSVRESVEQLHVTHTAPDTELELIDPNGVVVDAGHSDYQGSLIFREIEPGIGYRIATLGAPREVSRALSVVSVEDSVPPQEFYENAVLEPGYGYITMRDGTQLSVFVALPGPPEDGPYPVLVNYSGYDPSEPVGALAVGGFDLSFLCADFPVLCDAPGAPEALIAGVLGFATVGVNMRGTACSGGAYDFFEALQTTDGYDIVETVATQPWAGQVGMVGISFPGISQLFVASAQPPNLAAITPLAVISGADTTMNPGGIANIGFAVEWATNVLDQADPYGHGWEQGRADGGDTICEENQLLHSQKIDIVQKAFDNPFYVPELYDPLNPRTFVDRIQVPVFTSGAWQDEQTGGHFPDLWNRFTGAPIVRYTAYNGAHADGFTPQILAEWKNFLDFYVTGELRPVDPQIRFYAPLLFREIFGAVVQLPEERFAGVYDDFQDALAAYEAEPAVRILMESGGAPGTPLGAPVAGFELAFDAWPPPETEPLRLFLHEDGSLRDFTPSESASASSFAHDDAKGVETYDVSDSFEKALPDIEWLPATPGRQIVFATEPLAEDVVMIGHASADLWIQSDASDADLEVMLSEVRPDGQEMYIASGWLRASRRALSPESTPLEPVQTHLEADAAPLPSGEWTPLRIEIYPFGHAFRAGSRLAVAIATPGGNKGRWKFDVLQLGAGIRHAIAHSSEHPSSLLLPVIPAVEIPTPLPACPSLRSQPCRAWVPESNAPYAE